jgi:hypothetical protein
MRPSPTPTPTLTTRYDLALPGALQALQFATQVNGDDHIDLVGPFLILAEVNLGTGGLAQAESYLSRANWIVLKNPEASNALRSKLHRNFGKLYALKGEYVPSLRVRRAAAVLPSS